jgi:hypothetical protein
MNLESDIPESAGFNWSPLQIEVCMSVAMAKRDAFIAEAYRIGDLVRLRVLDRATAADTLHEAATYNELYFEYGRDEIQEIMASALDFRETPQLQLRPIENAA